ncbi:hypothetical protein BH20ACT5_BH20ACT5_22380 [soil metagenome]
MAVTKTDLLGELADRLGHEPLPVLEELRGALAESDQPVRSLDPVLWGPTPGVAEVRAASAANAVRLARERVAVAADSLTREEVAERLGISPQAVSNRIRAGRLVAIRAGRRWLLPAWQFDPEAADPVLPGIAELLAAWPGSVVALSRWAATPNRDLGDRAPERGLRDGAIGAVLAAARAITSGSWPAAANSSENSNSTRPRTTNPSQNRERCRETPVHDVPRHHRVELRGFEPLTPSMRTRCATGLRHSPEESSRTPPR